VCSSAMIMFSALSRPLDEGCEQKGHWPTGDCKSTAGYSRTRREKRVRSQE
jgi:hypothetical protein